MQERIRHLLISQADASYRDFAASLLPGEKQLLGVRLPFLRRLAKELVKDTAWRTTVGSYEGVNADIYFEETMLRGMMIGYGTAKSEIADALNLIKEFIPHIDNWSVCDSFCSSLCFAAKDKETVWEFLQEYLFSDEEFEVRTALIILLNQFLKYDKNGRKLPRKKQVTRADMERDTGAVNREEFPFLERILTVLNREYSQGYYAQMAAAWTTAEAFVTFPYETAKMLRDNCRMDVWTYRKALQKICESRNSDEEVKQYMRAMKQERQDY